MADPDQHGDQLTSCFYESAREELLLRVKHRDKWIVFNLIAQVTLWGLAKGVSFFGGQTTCDLNSSDKLFLILLQAPIATTFALLYFVEDNLIHSISEYLKSKFRGGWDGSCQLNRYKKDGLKTRMFAQIVVFVVTPVVLELPPIISRETTITSIESFFIIIAFLFIPYNICLILKNYIQRSSDPKGQSPIKCPCNDKCETTT